MPSVLIVCTANICRSPMAEALLKHQVSKRPDADQWHVASAGTWALEGLEPAIFSQQVMRTRGLDITHHQSQPVSRELLRNFDLILTMDNQQQEGLRLGFAEFRDKIYLLSEMVGSREDISDPIGGELADYEATAQKLEQIISTGLERITRLALTHHQDAIED